MGLYLRMQVYGHVRVIWVGCNVYVCVCRWGRVAAPTSLKSERIFSDRKMTLYIILEHPTATGLTTAHAMHILDTIQLHAPSPWARERREHRPPPAYAAHC